MNYEPRFTKEYNPFYQGGKAEGAKETSRKIALRLKEAGIPFEQIAKATELSPSVIKRLKNTDR
ncbi:hypothetical protein ACSBL2_24990 [Pedobacter sp. AW31-3R]|uniref:hypothetical protein n=1 Tax=Pedobacter sp. AW31-3R TaxID=3445781 RepID=UPI003F9FEF5F